MASADTQACNNCSYAGEDVWIILNECEHRNCTKCISDNVQKCETCRRAKTVECLYGSSGCKAVYKKQWVDQIENHLKTCDYRKVFCPNECPDRLDKKDLVHHVSDLCPKRLLPCSHCEENFFAEEMEWHLVSCDYFSLKCEFCEEEALRMDMNEHLNACPLAVWPCEFSTFGCDFKGTTEDLQKHITLSSHAKLITERERKSEEKMIRLLQQVEFLIDDRKTSEARLQACEEKQRYLEEDNKALKVEVMNAKRDCEALKEEIKTLKEELKGSIINQQGVNQKNEALRTQVTETTKEFKIWTEDLVRRLHVFDENNGRERKKLLRFCDSFRSELLPGLEAKEACGESEHVVLSCFELVKDWAVAMKQHQEIIMSREDIDVISYHSAFITFTATVHKSRVTLYDVFHLGFEKLAFVSRTFVLDPSLKVTTKEIKSPYESVKLVVRFRFLVRKDTTDIFAEVSHSTVSTVRVLLKKFPGRNVILDVTLTDVQKRVNKLPIFCDCVQTSDLSFGSNDFCYFVFNVS